MGELLVSGRDLAECGKVRKMNGRNTYLIFATRDEPVKRLVDKGPRTFYQLQIDLSWGPENHAQAMKDSSEDFQLFP